MEPRLFCQSCTMPIDDIADRGTEKDGSRSGEFCRYCFQDGAFTVPDMELGQMKSIVINQMHKRNLPEDIIEKSIDSLPHLKRWEKVPA